MKDDKMDSGKFVQDSFDNVGMMLLKSKEVVT